MSSIGAVQVAASTDAVNQILQNAQAMSVEQATKLMKVAVEIAVGQPGREPGKGSIVDYTG